MAIHGGNEGVGHRRQYVSTCVNVVLFSRQERTQIEPVQRPSARSPTCNNQQRTHHDVCVVRRLCRGNEAPRALSVLCCLSASSSSYIGAVGSVATAYGCLVLEWWSLRRLRKLIVVG